MYYIYIICYPYIRKVQKAKPRNSCWRSSFHSQKLGMVLVGILRKKVSFFKCANQPVSQRCIVFQFYICHFTVSNIVLLAGNLSTAEK